MNNLYSNKSYHLVNHNYIIWCIRPRNTRGDFTGVASWGSRVEEETWGRRKEKGGRGISFSWRGSKVLSRRRGMIPCWRGSKIPSGRRD